MPEIKHQFTGGKMNKDLDERLVPNGQYKDALNIQVSTSEASDVGTVQNILGNSEIAGQTFTTNAVCVGTAADEKNDKLYWFIKDVDRDSIIEYDSNTKNLKPVLVDTNNNTSNAVLKFNSNKIITGINVIDDLLFWTDNQSEPKVINIKRCIEGTINETTHTNFINTKRNPSLSVAIREEHITVIKRGPKTAPTVKLISQRTNDFDAIYSGVMRTTSPPIPMTVASPFDGYSYENGIPQEYNAQNQSSMWIGGSPQNHHYDFSQLSVGDYFDTYIETDIYGESGFTLDWKVNDILLFKEFGGQLYNEVPEIPLKDFSVKARIYYANHKNTGNIGMKISENNDPDALLDASSGDIISTDDQSFEITWKQGRYDKRIQFQSRLGFDGIISKVEIFKIAGEFPIGNPQLNDEGLQNNLHPNPDFKLTDGNGNDLQQWKIAGVTAEFGCQPNPGNIRSTNPDAESYPGAGDSFNTTEAASPGNGTYPIIDPVLYPCYPADYNYGDAPWIITYSDNTGGGQAKAADPLLTYESDDSHYNTNYDTWAYNANSLDVIGADGVTYSSNINSDGVETGGRYSLINQYGYMDFTVDDSNKWLYQGNTYTIKYTISDTGHNYPGRYGGNGYLTLGSAGFINPWLTANYFTDTKEETAVNGDFITPDANGDAPKSWHLSGNLADGTTSPWSYIPGKHYIEGGRNGSVADYQGGSYGPGINQSYVNIEPDVFYEVSFELTDMGDVAPNGDEIPSGGIFLALVGDNPDGNPNQDYWITPNVYTEGIHTFTIFTANPSSASGYGLTWGNRIFFKPAYGPGEPNDNPFIGRIQNVSVKRQDPPNANVRCEVLAINNPPVAPDSGELKYVVDRLDNINKIFEFKFPRFAYRYKYDDNEYSTISPFSPVAFMPGSFQYHSKEGYNIGMTNRLIEADIKDFRVGVPDGVVAIDILYKDDASPSIYVVDTIKPNHSTLSGGDTIWEEGKYTISSEQVSNMIPSNQLLRPWDAVPKRALAQDISGNRIIYANYTQGYDLHNEVDGELEEYYPDFKFDILSANNPNLLSSKSIKSLREYQLGVVFVDKHGRETPVISNFSGTQTIEKQEAENINKIQVGFNNNKFPQNMKYFKFFVKETSNEYYNLAMDKWYDAGDDNIWISFPSSDRNKVDIDTFLILKKGEESDVAVQQQAKYKILDIQNNAPDFIKQKVTLIEERKHEEGTPEKDIFGTAFSDAPLSNKDYFKINYLPFFDSSGDDLHEIKDGILYVDFSDTGNQTSKRYRITKISTDYAVGQEDPTKDTATYNIKLDKKLGADVDFISNSIDGLNATKINNKTTISIYKYTIENSPKFDGRFFVKIDATDIFNLNSNIILNPDLKYRTVVEKKLYYLSENSTAVGGLHNEELTGQKHGVYRDQDAGVSQDGVELGVQPGFGRFAPFFRNYNKPATGNQHRAQKLSSFWDNLSDPGYGLVDVGQYNFGTDPTGTERKPWLEELIWVTTFPGTDDTAYTSNNYGYEGEAINSLGFLRTVQGAGNADYNGFPGGYDYGDCNLSGVKIADDHGWSKEERQGLFVDGKQTHGDVWFIDGGKYHSTSINENLGQLKWPFGNNTIPPIEEQNGVETGLTVDGESSSIVIAMGGIHDSQVTIGAGSGCDPEAMEIDNFFNIGGSDGNTNHNHATTQNLVSRFSSGTHFKFKEDPNQEMYKIQPNVANKRRLRWNNSVPSPQAGDGFANNPNVTPAEERQGPSFRNELPVSLPYTQQTYNDYFWKHSLSPGTAGDSALNHYDYTNYATQLSPNFTRSWKPTFKNSSGGGTMGWNPIGDGNPGIIADGLQLSIPHSSLNGGGSNSNKFVVVDSLEGTNTDGTTHNITVGMILISHSNAATSYTGAAGLEYLAIKQIDEVDEDGGIKIHLTGYSTVLTNVEYEPISTVQTKHNIFSTAPAISQTMIFAQPKMNGYSQYSVNRINAQWPGLGGIAAIGYTLEFLEAVVEDTDDIIITNPAVWETEPKESIDLDIYHEASGLNPLQVEDTKTALLTIPLGSTVETVSGVFIEQGTVIDGVSLLGLDLEIILKSPSDGTYEAPILAWDDTADYVMGTLVGTPYITAGDRLKITKPNGEIIIVTIASPGWPSTINGVSNPDANGRTTTLIIKGDLYSIYTSYILNWHNCYSFGNGVESNRIRDNFNLPFISNGPKVSTTLEEDYKQEHRKYGLIYSGLYNSNSGVNNLNQFIAAEKITKDVNPIYGSIQKIHSRDSDLVTLCEDKCLRILVQKDAVFNADGNAQLLAREGVLGQTIPFSGEFGISKNPESFASESYRVYFTDRVRGTVMRLSKDGLTPISMYGMKDWFKDNLKLSTQLVTSKLIGSYDDKKDEYNITLKDINKTVSFREDVKGWVSFKSFVPQNGISCASEYYTFDSGKIWRHYDESVNRNNFYGDDYSSTLTVMLNEAPGSIKSFHALNYEGSQSKIDMYTNTSLAFDYQPTTSYNDQEYYNLSAKSGWFVESVITDQDIGRVNNFIGKEGKWFANMNKFIDLTL